MCYFNICIQHKKRLYIGTIIASLTLAFLIPYLIKQYIRSQIDEQVVMTPDTYNLWGLVPGDTGAVITRDVYFMNFTNPDEVLYQDKTPEFIQVGPYSYQEKQEKLQPTFYTEENKNLVSFNFWDYFISKNTDNKEQDKIHTLNLGSLGAWYFMNTSPDNGIAIRAFANILLNLETIIVPVSIAQGVTTTFIYPNGNKTFCVDQVFSYITNDPYLQEKLWSDEKYGWQKFDTLFEWIIAYENGLYEDKSLEIMDYFDLTVSQMNIILNGNLKSWYKNVFQILKDSYCQNTTQCDGKYLGNLQWSQSGITKNPPSTAINPMDSVTKLNKSLVGFPEINYFYEKNFLINISNASEYQNITFSVEWSMKISNHSDSTTEWLKHPWLILHLGNLEFLFDVGRQFQKTNNMTLLQAIQERFLLDNIYQTRVFWEYFRYLVDEFSVVESQRGTKGVLSIGYFLGNPLYVKFMKLQHFLLPYVTSQLQFYYMVQENSNCSMLINATLETINVEQAQQICDKVDFLKDWSHKSLIELNKICKLQGSKQHHDFQLLINFTNSNMSELCYNSQSYADGFQTYYSILNSSQIRIRDFYQCDSHFTKCSDYYFASRQFGNSSITNLVLPELNSTLQKSLSVHDWDPQLFQTPFEYPHFLQSVDLEQKYKGMSAEIIEKVFSFFGFFSAQCIQFCIINYKNKNPDWFYNYFNISTEFHEPFTKYFRFMLLNLEFNGFTQIRTVKELLFGYTDPYIENLAILDKKMGGDPSINPQIYIFLNQTANDTDQIQSMYTGEGTVDQAGQYYQINNQNYINIKEQKFNGNVTFFDYRNPWEANASIAGTDSTHNPTFLYDSDKPVNIYVNDAWRVVSLENSQEEIKYNGLTTLRYKISNKNFEKSSNSTYDQFKWNGFLNITVGKKAPLLISKVYYKDTSDDTPKAIIYADQEKKQILQPSENDESYIDIEPYSGASIAGSINLMQSYELVQDDLFSSKKFGPLPLSIVKRHGGWSNDNIQSKYGQLMQGLTFKTIFFVFFLVVGSMCIFLYARILYYEKYPKNNGDLEEQLIQESNKAF